METLRTTQAIELFHIAFLDMLARRVDQGRCFLKGGANLRYFFGSVRYSEDIDLDVEGVPYWRLGEKVGGLLESTQIRLLLGVKDLLIDDVSHAKDTETTQRWKIGIKAPGHSEPIRTKVEFSYRPAQGEYRLDRIPPDIVAPYALRPPTVQHYVGQTPTEQKVRALAGRSETQARDVFDLELLFRRDDLPAGLVEGEILEQAVDRALELDYDSYRGQVLPFLEPEAVELFGNVDDWERMQAFVAEKLEKAR